MKRKQLMDHCVIVPLTPNHELGHCETHNAHGSPIAGFCGAKANKRERQLIKQLDICELALKAALEQGIAKCECADKKVRDCPGCLGLLALKALNEEIA